MSPIQAALPISRSAPSRPPTGHTALEAAPLAAESARAEQEIVAASGLPSAQVSLRYVRNAPLRVTGEVSGRQYEFSATRPIQAMDPQDLFQLLSMGYFNKL
jgi:hypothetical protein